MKNTVYKLDQKNPQVLGFNDTHLILSSKHHTNFEALQSAVTNSGMLETVKVYELKSISKLTCVESDESLSVEFAVNDKVKKESFKFDNINAVRWVADAIASQENLRSEESEESPNGPLVINSGKIILALVISYLAVTAAADSSTGIEHDFEGRRSGLMKLAYFLLGLLGPYITAALAAGIIGYLAYTTYNRYKKPSKVLIYNR
jgi:hypothetical protein